MKVYAPCGLFCSVCHIYLASAHDSEQLKEFAGLRNMKAEDLYCEGCRSDKVNAVCQNCRIKTCTKENKINFCSECGEYPCDHLKDFKKLMPHMLELWDQLEKMKKLSHTELDEYVKNRYGCPQCGQINSAYDQYCRQCKHEPASHFFEDHQVEIKQFLSLKKKDS